MKKRPSDYCNGLRYLKRSNIPTPGSLFTITGIEEIEKSSKFTGKSECLIQVTFDERWQFDLKGSNLDTTIQLLGDDFTAWFGGKLGLRLSTFTTRDGSEQTYIQVVSPFAIEPRRLLQRKQPGSEDYKDETGSSGLVS
jgi:hypothetical protein